MIGTLFRTDDGGKGSNQAVGAARLGAEVSFLTAVGEDSFGDRAYELWETEGVDAAAVVRSAGADDDRGDPRRGERRQPDRDRPGRARRRSHPPTSTASRRRSRPPTSCSSSSRSRSRRRCMRSRSVAPPASARSLNPAPAPHGADHAGRRLRRPERDRGAGDPGARPRLWSSRSASRARGSARTLSRPSRRASSTRTGAGDAFCAAFAVALAEGASDLDAVRWGCAAGAHMVEHPGVIPGLPTARRSRNALRSQP